ALFLYGVLSLNVHRARPHPDLHSFPTRRSSDLLTGGSSNAGSTPSVKSASPLLASTRFHPLSSTTAGNGSCAVRTCRTASNTAADRKSTRLNSSHVAISYAVFCLKKKNNESEHK